MVSYVFETPTYLHLFLNLIQLSDIELYFQTKIMAHVLL